jgi:hypothetical protein
MRALLITPDTTVTEIDLSEPDAHSMIRERIAATGTVDQALYHRRALLHIHGDGCGMGLVLNTAAWALASAWRGMALYPIHGPVIVTGPADDGDVAPLDDDLAQHAHTVAKTVRETLGEWRTRRPCPMRRP